MTQHLFRPRIMICEDEPVIAMDIAAVVESCGCEAVGPFASAREAIASLKRQPVQAAILDIDLSDGASTPLARALRVAGVRMIVLSGLDVNSPPPEFAGVEWLTKPADERRLRDFCAAAIVTSALGASGYARPPEPAMPPAL